MEPMESGPAESIADGVRRQLDPRWITVQRVHSAIFIVIVAAVSFAAVVLAAIIHTFNYKRDFYIPASEVISTEEARTLQLARHV